MSDGFLKPPGFGVWLAATGGVALFASAFLGDTAAAIGGWVAVICGAIAAGVVMRWVGRCVGYAISSFAAAAWEGFNEGRADARQRRAQNLP